MRVIVAGAVAAVVLLSACGSDKADKQTSSTATTTVASATPSYTLPGSSTSLATAGAGATVRVTDADNGKTVTVKRGSHLVIALPDGSYTIGQQADPEVIYYLGTRKEPPSVVYEYRADKPGSAKLRIDGGNNFTLQVQVTQ